MRKDGFTLVELSIVLVIIGLLISGILVGQSLIDSARTQSYIKRMQQFEIAYDLFKERFGDLPGDSDKFTPPGDGDGILEYGIGGCTGAYTADNSSYAVSHLSQANMIDEDYDTYSPIACGGTDASTDDPSFACANEFVAGIGFESPLWQAAVGCPSSNEAIILFAHNVGIFAASTADNFVSGLDVLSTVAIDKKLDDGEGLTGSFLSVVVSDWVSSCNTAHCP